MVTNNASIRVHVNPKAGGGMSVCVASTRNGMVARALARPENRAAARRLLTLVFGLCPIAHLAAFDGALRAARSEDSRPEALKSLFYKAVRMEAIAENLRVLVVEAEKIARAGAAFAAFSDNFSRRAPQVSRENMRSVGLLRAMLSEVTDLLLVLSAREDWQEAEAHMCQTAQAQLFDILTLASATAQSALLGVPAQEFAAAADSPDLFEKWLGKKSADLPAPYLLSSLLNESRNSLRPCCSSELPVLDSLSKLKHTDFAEEISYRMLNDNGFDLAPFWKGTPRLTGAAARLQGCPALEGISRPEMTCPADLFAARILETAQMIAKAAREDSEAELIGLFAPHERTGFCLVETARGLLAHAAHASASGELEVLKITSPTEWQFSPNGPALRLVQPLVKGLPYPKTDAERGLVEMRLRRTLFVLDPCVPVDFAWSAAEPNLIGRGITANA